LATLEIIYDILTFVGGAASGAVGTLWKLNLEHLDERIDEAVEQVEEMAKLAAEYWVLPGNHPDAAKLSVLIVGKSRRIGLLISKILKRYRAFRWPNNRPLLLFRQAATGGPFQVLARQPDRHRAQDAQEAASDLITALREARKWW